MRATRSAHVLRSYHRSMMDEAAPTFPPRAQRHSVHCLAEYEHTMPASLAGLSAESEAVGAVVAARKCAASDSNPAGESVVQDKWLAKKEKRRAKRLAESVACQECHNRVFNEEPPLGKEAALAEDDERFSPSNTLLAEERARANTLLAEERARASASLTEVNDRAAAALVSASAEAAATLKAERKSRDKAAAAHKEEVRELHARLQLAESQEARLLAEHQSREARLLAEHQSKLSALRTQHTEHMSDTNSQHAARIVQFQEELDKHFEELGRVHAEKEGAQSQLSQSQEEARALRTRLDESQDVLRELMDICSEHKQLLTTVEGTLRATAERLPCHLKHCLLETQRSLRAAAERIDFD